VRSGNASNICTKSDYFYDLDKCRTTNPCHTAEMMAYTLSEIGQNQHWQKMICNKKVKNMAGCIFKNASLNALHRKSKDTTCSMIIF
jgi:hypothetical protein